MRIIGGRFRGRVLTTPPDERTRPMLEQSRAAVFNMIGDAPAGARVLDLYSGTGSLGLEALSRGAESICFVERDRLALGCLEENIKKLDAGNSCNIKKTTVEIAVRAETQNYQIIFLDPPYPEIAPGAPRRAMLTILADLYHRILAPEGTLIFHFPTGSLHEADFAGMNLHRMRGYGRNSVAIFIKNTQTPSES